MKWASLSNWIHRAMLSVAELNWLAKGGIEMNVESLYYAYSRTKKSVANSSSHRYNKVGSIHLNQIIRRCAIVLVAEYSVSSITRMIVHKIKYQTQFSSVEMVLLFQFVVFIFQRSFVCTFSFYFWQRGNNSLCPFCILCAPKVN